MDTSWLMRAGRIAEERGWDDPLVVEVEGLQTEGPTGAPIVAVAVNPVTLAQAQTIASLAGAGREVALIGDQRLDDDVRRSLPSSALTGDFLVADLATSGSTPESVPDSASPSPLTPVELLRDELLTMGYVPGEYDGLDGSTLPDPQQFGVPRIRAVSLDTPFDSDPGVVRVFRADLDLEGEPLELWMAFGISQYFYWSLVPCASPMQPTSSDDYVILDDMSRAISVPDGYDTERTTFAGTTVRNPSPNRFPPRWHRYLVSKGYGRYPGVESAFNPGHTTLWFLAWALYRITAQHGTATVTQWLPELSDGIVEAFTRTD